MKGIAKVTQGIDYRVLGTFDSADLSEAIVQCRAMSEDEVDKLVKRLKDRTTGFTFGS